MSREMRYFCVDFFRAFFDILKWSRRKTNEKKIRKKIHLTTMGSYARCLLITFATSTLHAQFSVGMESAHIKRMRDGGTQQNGRIDGIRLSYNRLQRFYFGGDYFYGSAKLIGHTGSQRPISSILTDKVYEGRVGCSFSDKNHFFFLFSGYGYYHEVNDFFPPTPIPFKFTDTFNYIPVGFLSGVYSSSLLSMGFSFKMMFMQKAQTKISDDPAHDDVVLKMNEEINVRIELPLVLSPSCTRMNLRFSLTPFYEFRHYGGREDYPSDYLDTKFILLGARIALVANF